jgi:argininosuccinate lyase
MLFYRSLDHEGRCGKLAGTKGLTDRIIEILEDDLAGKLWGGRFSGQTNELMERFNASFSFDRRLYAADVRGSIAYAAVLARASLISEAEAADLMVGLGRILTEFESGVFEAHSGDEDIHTAVERRLGELIGPVAGKLHTGRSRNDQVATDMRLYLMDKIDVLTGLLSELQAALVERAEADLELIMPGYTHLQQAQPILFSHWLLSFFWMLERDRDRLNQSRARVSILPLGSGALAGHSLGIDREFLAKELGFRSVSENSMDAVGDRDFLLEFLAWAAILQVHLSRLAEDLILWSSREFGFVELDDAYSTGSSLMPQKKNPDSMELVRGKSGRLIGNLVSLLTTAKGLPSTYDKDLQEDKEPVFDTVDTLEMVLPVAAGVIATLKVNAERMSAALDDGMLATDLADYLVRKGVPFREAHHLVGQVVRRAIDRGVALRELSTGDFRAISDHFGADVYSVFDFHRSIAAKSSRGGTAQEAVADQIRRAREALASS